MFPVFHSKRQERLSPLTKRFAEREQPRGIASQSTLTDAQDASSTSKRRCAGPNTSLQKSSPLLHLSSRSQKHRQLSLQVTEDIVQVPDDIVLIQEYVHSLESVRCSECNTSQSIEPSDITKLSEGWLKQHILMTCSHPCHQASCSVMLCGGCGRANAFTQYQVFKMGSDERRVSWCCEPGLMFGIWVMACGMSADDLSSSKDSIEVTKRRSRQHNSQMKKSEVQALPAGTGYASGLTICGLLKWIFTPKNRAQRTSARQLEKRPATLETSVSPECYLRSLAALITARGPTADSSNFLFRAMMVRSPWVSYAAAMLGSDSLETACKDHKNYDGVLDLLSALLRHPITVPLVTVRQSIPQKIKHHLLAVSFDNMELGDTSKKAEPGRSFLELLTPTVSQARLILAKSRQHPADFKHGEGAVMQRLAFKVNKIHEKASLLNEKSKLERSTSRKSQTEPMTTEVTMTQWHKEACLESIDDEFFKLPYQYAFSKDAAETMSTKPPHGRMKCLITEISSFRTSLPEGIFVRYAASRLDMMKVLIIGPSGTPYEHGFFEFDIMCGMEYPRDPPNVAFRTTNGGQIRMNPNLYSDGTVCLSLLGTWPGETWKPGQSTLLQILVSLQAMVLCDKPWYNEPGRSSIVSARESLVYNAAIRHDTLMYAILPWIELIKYHKNESGTVALTADTLSSLNAVDALKPVITSHRRHFIDEERDQMIGCSTSIVSETMAFLTANAVTAAQIQAAHAASKNCILPFMAVPSANVPNMSRICWLETAQIFFNQHAKDVAMMQFFEPAGNPVSRPGNLVKLGSGVPDTPLRNAESLVKTLLVKKGYLG